MTQSIDHYLGDLLPEINLVTDGDAKALLISVNHRVSDTNDEFVRAIQKKKITEADFQHWTAFGARWGAWYNHNINQYFFDAAEVMDVTDRFDQERLSLRNWLSTLAPDETPGPDTTTNPPKTPDSGWNVNLGLFLGVVGLGVVAYMVGPAVRTWTSSWATKSAAKANPVGNVDPKPGDYVAFGRSQARVLEVKQGLVYLETESGERVSRTLRDIHWYRAREMATADWGRGEMSMYSWHGPEKIK